MSRFDFEGDGDWYANAGDLWWANIGRALAGKKGQRDLRDLEAALVALPEPRLVKGRLARKGDVCAVGALATHRRVSAGEARADVLAQLEATIPMFCECGHSVTDHEVGSCKRCAEYAGAGWGSGCQEFREDDEYNEDGEYVTSREGQNVGLTYALAWRFAYLNDEDFGNDTPEQRYEHVLAWVRSAIAPLASATAPPLQGEPPKNGSGGAA